MVAIRPNIPSEAEAPALAKKALEPYGGLPEDAVLALVEQVTSITYDGSLGRVVNEQPMWTSVHYRQRINGSPTKGPGPSITVLLGENGEVLDLDIEWRTLEYAGEVPIISVEEAFGKLKRGETLAYGPTCCLLPLVVSDIELGYYAESVDVDQASYTPVWLFYVGELGSNTYPRPVNAVKQTL